MAQQGSEKNFGKEGSINGHRSIILVSYHIGGEATDYPRPGHESTKYASSHRGWKRGGGLAGGGVSG